MLLANQLSFHFKGAVILNLTIILAINDAMLMASDIAIGLSRLYLCNK